MLYYHIIIFRLSFMITLTTVYTLFYITATTSQEKFFAKMSLEVNISEPEEFNCIELHSCIEDVAKMKGFNDFVYHVDFMYGKGENYVANIFRVLIKEAGNECCNISVIVKTLMNSARQELFNELHKREVFVYEKVMPIFKDLQEMLYTKDRIMLPECILSKYDKGNEVLILEDLLINGFDITNKLERFESLDYHEVKLVVTNLAKFHALSFICERRRPEKYKEIKENLPDIIYQDHFINRSKLRNYFPESFNNSLRLVTDLEAKKKLQKVYSKLLNILRSYVKPRKHNVFSHGDCWINNIAFKYKDNKCVKLCFLDFQAMRYACPVIDIVYFLYICTDSTFRSKHFNELKDDYYESQKSFLELFKINVNEVYPRDSFESDLEEFLPFGLLNAILQLRIVTSLPEEDTILKGRAIVPGMGNDTNETVPGEISLLSIAINDVVKESVENGALDKLVAKINDI